ncbi:MAG: methionyl-tRNA formyltransferase [Candidatus Brocadiia bacterium]
MRLLFFGSPDFSVPTLRVLHRDEHDIALVVTRPDRPRGRGREPAATAVKKAAAELGLEVYQPETVNSEAAVTRFRGTRADLAVVIAYGEILSRDVLASTERGFINVHASLLPDYRGAAPINWAVMRGEETTGVSVIRMSPELDAGPILATREVPIGPAETAGELHDRLAEVGAEAAADVVNRMEEGLPVEERPQPEEGRFFARKLTKEDGMMDWSRKAEDIRNRVRGLRPWPGAYSYLESADGRVRVELLRVETAEADGDGEPPGTVLRADDQEGIVVQTGDGTVRLTELKPAGGRAMSDVDFLHGHPVEPGDRFVSEV